MGFNAIEVRRWWRLTPMMNAEAAMTAMSAGVYMIGICWVCMLWPSIVICSVVGWMALTMSRNVEAASPSIARTSPAFNACNSL